MVAKKRTDQRLGHRTKAEQKVDKPQATEPVEIPEPDENWHPIVLRLYDGLRKSPHNVYMTSADWSYAFLAMDSVQEYLHSTSSNGRSAMKLSAINDMLKSLLFTESDRRKANIEIQRSEPEPEEEPNIADELAALRGKRSS